MGVFILLIYIVTYTIYYVQAAPNYINSTHDFFVPLYKAVASQSNVNFAFSPHSVWIMLAAIAEGSNQETQQKLFKLLNLPDDPYARQKYYKILTSSVVPANGISLVETRTLFIDENLNLNSAWLNIILQNSLLDIVTIPMQYNPVLTENWIKRFTIGNAPRFDVSGNSVLLNTIDYNGLWAGAFNDAIIENSPFYNQEGEEIGTVDLMRIKRRVKIGHIKSMNAKVMELLVGSDKKYRMLFVIKLDKKDIKHAIKDINNDIIIEMFSSLKYTNVPIDIAIPRFKITSEIDMREILRDLGVSDIWRDPEATKYISTPPAFPTTFIQRTTAALNKYGLIPSTSEQSPSLRSPTELDAEVGKDFIANRPLLFGLFNAETFTPVLAVGISQPTTYKFGTTYLRKI